MSAPDMECRPGCGACCIAPSISSPLPGMPHGKKAGERCVNLGLDGLCAVWGTPQYPPVCRNFRPGRWVCGDNREEALALLTALEKVTDPRGGGKRALDNAYVFRYAYKRRLQ